jgi:polar amino acid transport system substrate-binding protein
MLHEAFTPTGKLRAAINLGNPILANRKEGGEVFGVSVDLARELATRLGAELVLVVVDGAAKSVDAVRNGAADIGFFAIDPARSDGIQFTPPYVMIEGSYLVRQDSPLKTNDEVDRAGHRIAVGGGSAYDLYLSRAIKSAQLVRVATSQQVVPGFLEQQLEVAAGVRQQLEADAQRLPGLRLLPGRFMAIYQAMGLPSGRPADAHSYLKDYVEEQKASGFVAAALARHGVKGALVAPPGMP